MNALLAYVNDSDFRLNHRLVCWRAPRWFRVVMITATRLADGWLWFATGLLLLACGGLGLRVMGAATIAAAIANSLLVMVKRRVRRPRPCEIEPNPHLAKAYRPCFAGDAFSFPSGHSLNAFAVGTVIALAFPTVAFPIFVIASSIAASRVFLGLHFLTDVLAGALLGAAIGLAIFAAFRP